MKRIYLVGFMGCGKSAVGRRLSFLLKMPYYDMDKEIVRQNGMAITEIFETFGEAHFRNLETQFLKDLKHEDCIISTGGGVSIREENRKIMRQTGLVLFLDAPFREIWRRIHKDTKRPIVVKSTREQIEAMYKARYPLYKAAAHITIRTEFRTLRQITQYAAFQVNRLKGE
ncbi:shikimate kinase [Planococcus beigongshangi]|uniref:shikimate kinase n=1 Tax=Planococcus beigongshangi TaxID=2782536 RepID=UPI00193BC10A|nr:shikimate kinase [Planococcus beigongshangi]